MDQPRQGQRRNKVAPIILTALALLMSMTVLGAPSADAHSGKFEHADRVPADQACPEGAVPNGASVENLFDRFGPYIGCDHLGYSPIGGDVPLCEEARGSFVEGLCTFDRSQPCGDDPAFVTEISDGMCLRLAVVLDEFAPVQAGPARSVAPVCVESELVQVNASGASVGAQFSIGSNDYLIVTGAPCTFNCLQGWDINCDGKLGDFCASEYDLSKVADVGGCMSAMEDAATTVE